MTVLDGFIQGVIQGLTEFLPVSSDGHLSLFQHFFGLAGENALFFTVILHVGTRAAVFIAFYKTIFQMVVEFFRMVGAICKKQFKYRKSTRLSIVCLTDHSLPASSRYFSSLRFTRCRALSMDLTWRPSLSAISW